MKPTGNNKIDRFVSSIAELAKSQDINLILGTDFSDFEARVKNQPERHAIGPMFSVSGNALDEKSGFWIVGTNSDGEIVHTQAMRVVELGKQTLADHLSVRMPEYIPFPIDRKKSRYCTTPGGRMITGSACYHGELWLKGGQGGYRGGGMTTLLARLALVIGLHQLSANYTFGFMYSMAACKGLAAREGYMHTDPGCMFWSRPGQELVNETWMVWMGREDIKHIMNIPPSGLFGQFESRKSSYQRQKAA